VTTLTPSKPRKVLRRHAFLFLFSLLLFVGLFIFGLSLWQAVSDLSSDKLFFALDKNNRYFLIWRMGFYLAVILAWAPVLMRLQSRARHLAAKNKLQALKRYRLPLCAVFVFYELVIVQQGFVWIIGKGV